MAQRYVYGTYVSFMEAEQAAEELLKEGIPKDSISLVANSRLTETSREKFEFIPTEEATDTRNWFQKLFGMQSEEEPANEMDFTDYSDSLENDQVLLVVDQVHQEKLGRNPVPSDKEYAKESDRRTQKIVDGYLDPSNPARSQMTPDEFNTQSITGARPNPADDLDLRNQRDP